jgi:hypothetical protein
VRIIKQHIGAGIPKDEAERLGLPKEDYLPDTAEEMIVAHADNLMNDTKRISIDEQIRKGKRGFDSDAIDRMIRLHTAVMGCGRRSCLMVLIVLFTEVLYGISSDLPYMGQETLCHDQYTVLVHTGHIRSAGTGVAKPNAKPRGTGSVLKSGV